VRSRDDALAPPVVTDRAARRLDAARQRRLAHETVAPHRVEQLLLAHDAVGVRHEVDQHVEHLRLDRHPDTSAVQLVPIEIELGIAEGEDHGLLGSQRGVMVASRFQLGRPA
jgi:hypothetical protein